MDDYGRFAQWFTPWKSARPDIDTRPIGWYTMADLEAAFHGGRADQHQQVLDEILERTRALEELLRGGTDDRPGTPLGSPPPAGPVPTQD